MLSAESASGQYPREAVATMNRIAETVEAEEIYPGIIDVAARRRPRRTGADAIAGRRATSPTRWRSKVICAWTASGSTGLRIARERPRSSILALTPDRRDRAPARRGLGRPRRRHATTRATSATWPTAPAATPISTASRGVGERVIVVAGVPFGTPGATNNLRIAVVGPDGGSA